MTSPTTTKTSTPQLDSGITIISRSTRHNNFTLFFTSLPPKLIGLRQFLIKYYLIHYLIPNNSYKLSSTLIRRKLQQTNGPSLSYTTSKPFIPCTLIDTYPKNLNTQIFFHSIWTHIERNSTLMILHWFISEPSRISTNQSTVCLHSSVTTKIFVEPNHS